MLIMRFHRLIQSRLLWMFFLGVVVVSFVFWGAMNDSDVRNPAVARLRTPVGHIRGEPVTFQRFDSTRRILSREVGRRVPSEALDSMVWNRLLLVDFAERCGLEVPRTYARRQFLLNFYDDKGALDTALRQNFLASLRADNLSEEDFVRFTRDSLLLTTLQRAFGSFTLVSPFDAERWALLQTDRLEIVYATVGDNNLQEAPTATEEQIVAFHAANPDRFQIPEKRIVRYVEVPVNLPTVPEGETVPEEVATKAREMAEETAMSYGVRLTPRRGRPAVTLEQLATEAGLEIGTAGPFSQRDVLDNIPGYWTFIRAAFELDASPIGRNSPPVNAGDRFYVLQLQDIIPARPSQLEEVRADVVEAVSADLRRQAVATLASNLVTEICADVAAGAAFKDAAESRGLTVTAPPAFQLKDTRSLMGVLPPGLPEAAIGYGKGEVFGPIPSMFGGGLYIGYVANREPVPDARAEMATSLLAEIEQGIAARGFFERFEAMVLRTDLKIEGASSRTEEAVDQP